MKPPKVPEGNYRDYYDKEYLAAEDLEENREFPMTISRVMVEEVFNPGTKKKEDVLVAYFSEMEERHRKDPSKLNKRVILGAIWNSRVLAEITGSTKPADWNDVPVFIYRGNDGSRDKSQYGVRIKARKVEKP